MEPIELPELLTLVFTQDEVMTVMSSLQFSLTILGEEDQSTRMELAELYRDIVSQVENQVRPEVNEDV